MEWVNIDWRSFYQMCWSFSCCCGSLFPKEKELMQLLIVYEKGWLGQPKYGAKILYLLPTVSVPTKKIFTSYKNKAIRSLKSNQNAPVWWMRPCELIKIFACNFTERDKNGGRRQAQARESNCKADVSKSEQIGSQTRPVLVFCGGFLIKGSLFSNSRKPL